MRVWVDLTNTAHVVVLRPLVERLEAAGHEVVLTVRPLSATVERATARDRVLLLLVVLPDVLHRSADT